MRNRSPVLLLPALLVTAILAWIGRVSHGPLANQDTYFHLRIGEELLSGDWSLWHPGHFSSYSSNDWVSTQWLAQLMMAGAERVAGLDGVAWLSCLVLLAFVGSLWWAARQWTGAPLAALLVLGGIGRGHG